MVHTHIDSMIRFVNTARLYFHFHGHLLILKWLSLFSCLFIYTEAFEQQPANNWRGVFSISSYSQYFDVDTDIVVIRLISSLNPVAGDFFSKIDANPDLCVIFFTLYTLNYQNRETHFDYIVKYLNWGKF